LAAIQSVLVPLTNQSVAEYWNFIFPADLMNNERFFINFTFKNHTPDEKTLKLNRIFTPNAEQKKLNNVRRQLSKRLSPVSSKGKRNLFMKCTAPLVSTFPSCLTGCVRWMIAVKKPRLMSWPLTWRLVWRCSCSNRVLAINTASTVGTYSSRRITGVCLVLRCHTVIPSRMSWACCIFSKSNSWNTRWFRFWFNARPAWARFRHAMPWVKWAGTGAY